MTMMVAITVWALIVGSGFWALRAYESTPGGTVSTPGVWPVDSAVRFDRERANLVMFAHPLCPCTLASVDELAALVKSAGNAVAISVVFIEPSGLDPRWRRSEVCRRVNSIPGIRVLDDRDGVEAARFGVKTSGHVLVFDRSGHRLFSGGITQARGMLGNNLGRSTVSAILTGKLKPKSDAVCPTYGCELFDPETGENRRMWTSER